MMVPNYTVVLNLMVLVCPRGKGTSRYHLNYEAINTMVVAYRRTGKTQGSELWHFSEDGKYCNTLVISS